MGVGTLSASAGRHADSVIVVAVAECVEEKLAALDILGLEVAAERMLSPGVVYRFRINAVEPQAPRSNAALGRGRDEFKPLAVPDRVEHKSRIVAPAWNDPRQHLAAQPAPLGTLITRPSASAPALGGSLPSVTCSAPHALPAL